MLASLSLQCCEHFKNRPELSARTWKLRGERSVREMFIFQCGNFLPLDIPRVTGATLSVWTPDSRSPDNTTYYMAHISTFQYHKGNIVGDGKTGGLKEKEGWEKWSGGAGQEWRALTGAKLALLSIFSLQLRCWPGPEGGWSRARRWPGPGLRGPSLTQSALRGSESSEVAGQQQLCSNINININYYWAPKSKLESKNILPNFTVMFSLALYQYNW